jgi:hypothetical protein
VPPYMRPNVWRLLLVSRHAEHKGRITSSAYAVSFFEFNIVGCRDTRHLIKIGEKVF